MRLALALAGLATPAFALDCPEGQRAFAHAMLEGGEACVPTDPRRVALVHTEAIPAFLMGVETVTSNVYFEMFLSTHPGAVPAGWREAVPSIGYLPDSDPEAVAAAAPDLIVSASHHPEMNARLREIAPLVVLDYSDPSLTWRDSQDFLARLFGREAELAAMMAGYEARLADLRSRLEGEGLTFSQVQVGGSPGELYAYTEASFGGQIMAEAGMRIADSILDPAEAQALNSPAWYTLSPERVGDLEADWIVFLPGYDLGAEAEFAASPGWNSLAAVREGRLIRPVDEEGQSWARENLAFAHMVIDDLYRDVLGLAPPPTANPFADWMTPAE